jgi:hypothetical protein
MFYSFLKLTDVPFDWFVPIIIVGDPSRPLKIVILEGTLVQIVFGSLLAFLTLCDVVFEVALEIAGFVEDEFPRALADVVVE